MIENAKEPTVFINKRLLIYIRNSERTQKRNKLAAKIVTTGILELKTFFFTLQSSQQIPH